MSCQRPGRARTFVHWSAVTAAILTPIIAAVFSPLLAWRDPIYIAGGFAGIIALGLMLLQPLLAAGLLPGPSLMIARRIHRWVGSGIVLAILVHVGALWITSPPDMIDALLLASPTPFSLWGVIAMWAIFAAALLVALRRRLPLRPQNWRRIHRSLVTVVVLSGVTHTLLIEGTMESLSKWGLCGLVLAATVLALWKIRTRSRR